MSFLWTMYPKAGTMTRKQQNKITPKWMDFGRWQASLFLLGGACWGVFIQSTGLMVASFSLLAIPTATLSVTSVWSGHSGASWSGQQVFWPRRRNVGDVGLGEDAEPHGDVRPQRWRVFTPESPLNWWGIFYQWAGHELRRRQYTMWVPTWCESCLDRRIVRLCQLATAAHLLVYKHRVCERGSPHNKTA